MAESVQLPLTGAGDITSEVAVNATPSGTVIQLIKDDSADPQSASLLASALGAGASVDLDGTIITNAKKGQLIAADIGSSVPLRVDLQTVAGSRVTRTTVYIQSGQSELWRSPGASYIEQLGTGTEKFGVSVTNLSPHLTADARITLFWDEVTP
jgi:hypothetical protein